MPRSSFSTNHPSFPRRNKLQERSNLISSIKDKYISLDQTDPSSYKRFDAFPLSLPTLKALNLNNFTQPTEIQRRVLGPALLGKDIVVEARTGSGKTLAFIIPILENLFLSGATSLDGPVAIILTPTRELARQIFLVLQHVSKYHSFTIINIMGGKNLALQKEEWACIARANILVGTPGRLAHHQQQNPYLNMSSLRILVLDEADRLLDPTFRHDLQAILENLTPDRQTMLFSATQTKLLDQLIRLNMRNPLTVSTSLSKNSVTPAQLIQSYAIVPLEKKLDFLWAFLQSHCKKKIIVFFSTQKQVRFIYDLFHLMQPYYTLLQLRGNMLQIRRFQIYDKFLNSRKGAVLFATNLAERGLDFPDVNWVVQFDCPKQMDDYIHRVGRTARLERPGKAVTFLLPSERAFVDLLKERGIELVQQKFPESLVKPIVSNRAPALLASRTELAHSARLAFIAYLRDYSYVPKSASVSKSDGQTGACAHLQTMHNLAKQMGRVFQPNELPIQEFAASLGLTCMPELPQVFSVKLDPALLKRIKQARATQLECPLSESKDICPVDQPSDTLRYHSRLLKEVVSPLSNPSNSKIEFTSIGVEYEEEDDDILLRRKPDSLLENSKLAAKAAATGRKLLDLASEDSSGNSSGEDVRESSAVWDKSGNQKTKGQILSDGDSNCEQSAVICKKSSAKKPRLLTQVKIAKRELRKNIRPHTKIEFDKEGKPIRKLIGGVTVATDNFGNLDESLSSPPVGILDIETDKKHLKQVVDKHDKEVWRKMIRDRHKAERLRAKQARREEAARFGRLGQPCTAELHGDSEDTEDEDASSNSSSVKKDSKASHSSPDEDCLMDDELLDSDLGDVIVSGDEVADTY